MNFIRVGVIDFFGILCPGILLSINLVVLLFAFNAPLNLFLQSASIPKGELTISILLFVICYLLGLVLRLIPPDNVDRISSLFSKLNPCHFIKKRKITSLLIKKARISTNLKKKEMNLLLNHYYNNQIKKSLPLPAFFWKQECYPYYIGNKHIFFRDFPPRIASKIMSKEKHHNKTTYNFWKTYLATQDPNLAILIFQVEALIRFMSGSFWALLIGVISGAILTYSKFRAGSNIILSA